MKNLFLAAAATAVWAEPPATQVAKELILDLGNKATLKLVQIPAGKFIMGSPETGNGHEKSEVQHEVTISKPTGADAGGRRVVRGGSWCTNSRGCRAAFRNEVDPDNRVDDFGFRVAVAAGSN